MSDNFNEKVNEAKDKAKEAFDIGKEKVGAFMEENDVKGKANAAKDKVHEKIKGLAFRGMLEKKISAETRTKFPVLDKLIPLTNYIVCILMVVVAVAVVRNVAGGGASTSISVPPSLNGQAFITLPLASVTTGYSEPNLNSLSRRNNQFNVIVEEGMEPLWNRVRSLYGIEVGSDWLLIMTGEEIMNSVGVAIDNNYHILYIASNSSLMDALVRGSSGMLALCSDPKNALNN